MSIQKTVAKISAREQLHAMEKFTQAYVLYENNKHLRESMCMAAQLPAMLVDIQAGDPFAGRLSPLPICFLPQGDGVDAYCYCYYPERFKALRSDPSLRGLEKQRLDALQSFWQEHHTAKKAERMYSADVLRMVQNQYEGQNAAAAMYRIAGTYLDYDTLLNLGIPGMQQRINAFMQATAAEGKNAEFYEACGHMLEVFCSVILRYICDAKTQMEGSVAPQHKSRLVALSDALSHLLVAPPQNAREALQLIWLYSLVAGAVEYGRMDDYLSRYYKEESARNEESKNELIHLLVGFFEMTQLSPQHMDQRIVIGGYGRKDEKASDFVAMCAIEASRIVKAPVPQLTLRLHKTLNAAVYELALDALSEGITFPILYNDEVNIPAVAKSFGVDLSEATHYLPLGCGEFALDHRSYSTPSGYINLLKVLELTLTDGLDLYSGHYDSLHLGGYEGFDTFEKLWKAYTQYVDYYMALLAEQELQEYRSAADDASFLMISMLYDDCLSRNQALFDGGIRYLGGTVESYGFVNTADALTAIKLLVFTERSVALSVLMDAIKNDFKGFEDLRKRLENCPKYGNDVDAADEMAARVHRQVCFSAQKHCPKELTYYLVVHINNHSNTILGRSTAASADGRYCGMFLANANNPMSGMDKNGITAMLNSLLKIDADIHAGVVQNTKLSKEMFGKKRQQTEALLRAYFEGGGTQIMLNVLGREDLERAINQPHLFSNLIVRVGGFSARFVELDADVQQEILLRTTY